MTLSIVGAFGVGFSAVACGPDTDCELENGHSYRVYAPSNLQSGTEPGALVFAHGYKGSSAGTIRNRRLRGLADELGVVLIALDAKMDDWSLPNAPSQSTDADLDEMAYLDAVMADAARFGINPKRTVVAGFSAGGMMTWNVACARGPKFAGYVPISGVFWAPVPDACAAPAGSLIHLHGTEDRIVPLAGRPIANTRQGDVRASIEMYAAHGSFVSEGQAEYDALACSEKRNSTGQRLDLCLSSGGHGFKIADLRAALQRLDPDGW